MSRLRPQRGTRALPRATAGARDLVTERAAMQIPWLESGPAAGRRSACSPRRPARVTTRRRRPVRALRYADAYELAKQESPPSSVSTRSPIRTTWAVARSAEGVGATGVVIPAHGSVRVTPAVCRSSAGAVGTCRRGRAEPGAVPRGREEQRPLGLRRRLRRLGPRCGTRISRGRRTRLRCRGKGVRPLVRRTCDATVRIPLGGKVGSLNVSVAAAVLLFETRRQRMLHDG